MRFGTGLLDHEDVLYRSRGRQVGDQRGQLASGLG
jgi:hypothetical protein